VTSTQSTARFERIRDVLLPVLVLVAGTVFFRAGSADVEWMRAWADGGNWSIGELPLWKAFYRYGSYPALLAAAVALGVLLVGLRRAGLAPFRRPALFVVLLMAIGPGLVANALLKDHWGRPRPREVVALGGTQPFEPVLVRDPASTGKSFPCGHATMGFYLVAGYFIWRKRRPAVAWCAAALALAGGVLIGCARMVQGGHFPSDVLWAGGLMWLIAAVLAHALQVETPPRPVGGFRPTGWGRIALVGLLVPLLVFLGLLATPIDRSESRAPQVQGSKEAPVTARVIVPRGTVRIAPGDGFRIGTKVRGFGLPGSGLKSVWKDERGTNGLLRLECKQRESGLFTELEQDLHVVYAPNATARLKLVQTRGLAEVRLPRERARSPRKWDIELDRGRLVLVAGELPVRIEVNGKSERDDPEPADVLEIKLGADATWETGK
jgi:membrane-associated PAP2 superfamily phosphatase